MTDLDDCHIRTALRLAAQSPCRSKRGVALFNARTGAYRGGGHNGPPLPLACPGRSVCAGNCGKRSVHAEIRALREAATYHQYYDLDHIELVHVELAADGGVVACDGPRCIGCAAQILDVGFVQGVWLYESPVTDGAQAWIDWYAGVEPQRIAPAWRRYGAEEFYAATLKRCGMKP